MNKMVQDLCFKPMRVINLLLISLLFINFTVFSVAGESDDEGSLTSSSSIVFSRTDKSSDDEGDERNEFVSRAWTFMLLDRTRVESERLDKPLTQSFWPFIIPRVQEKYLEEEKKGEMGLPYFEFKNVDVGGDVCWVCKLNLPDSGNTIEELVDDLMEKKKDDLPGDAKSDLPKRFSSAIAFFPIKTDTDKFFVYVFGRWLSLLNVDAVVRNFGLRAAVTNDLFGGTGERARRLSAVESEDVRVTDIMNARLRSRKALYPLGSFKLIAGESRIEAIKFKPRESKWGKAHIIASDLLRFRMATPKKRPLASLRARALALFERFCDRTKDCIYKGFLPYVSIPVDEALSAELTGELIKNWAGYFPTKESKEEEEEIEDTVIYPHWTYWFRMRHIADKSDLFSFRGRTKFSGEEIINIPGFGDVKVLNLIRTRPISYDSKFYWFDRGEWFEISETTVKLMRSELERAGEKLDYRSLELPSYDEESIKRDKVTPKKGEGDEEEDEGKSSGLGDYEEQAYNKAIFQHLKTIYPKSDVSLMDRTDTYMSSKKDKFEFADIVFKDANGIYYLVHVKRAKSNQLGHVCTQAERSALYLSGHLDRSTLEYAFMVAELNMLEGVTFLGKGISFPPVESITADTVEVFKENLKTKVLTLADKSKRKSKREEPPIYKVLRDFIETKDFDAEFWRLHPHSLLKLFEKISRLDLKKKGLEERLKKVHDAAKEGVRKSLFFSEGITLSSKKRSNIKIMIAVVDDGDSEFTLRGEGEEERTNRTVRLHQARQVIRHRHFDFGWTVIPKKSAVLPSTLEEYPYHSGDLDTLLDVKFPPNAKKLGGFPTVNIGTTRGRMMVRCYKSMKKKGITRKFIVSPYSKSTHDHRAKTPESYLAQVIQKAYEGGYMVGGHEIYFPFEVLPRVWVLVKLVLPTGDSTEVLPTVLHGNYYNIKKLKDKSETFIRALIRLNDFQNLRKTETSKSKSFSKKKKTKKSSPVPSMTMGEITFEPNLSWENMVDSGPAIFEHMVLLLEGGKEPDVDDKVNYLAVRRDHFELLQKPKKKKNFVKPFELENGEIVLKKGESFDFHPDSVMAGFRPGSRKSANKPKKDSGSAAASEEEDGSSSSSSSSSTSLADESEGKSSVEAVRKIAEKVYGKEGGYDGVTDEVYEIDGQHFLRVKMKGDGDCCFHALGTSREDLIGRIKDYIDEGGALDDSDRSEYERFTDALVTDIWTAVGNDDLLKRIDDYFRAFDVDPDDEAKCSITDEQLNALKVVLGLNDKQLKYIRYRYEYKFATKERKKEIIEDIYTTDHDNNWFDPSAIIPIGMRFDLNVKLYQRNVEGVLEEMATTEIPAGVESPYPQRNLLYVNKNHYDLLHPFPLEEEEK